MPDPVLPDPPANWSVFMDKVKAVIAAIKDVIIMIAVLYAAVKADIAAALSNEVKTGQTITHQKQDAAVAKADAVENKVEKMTTALPNVVASEIQKSKGKE